jgi:AcrR family transcriptional regulator
MRGANDAESGRPSSIQRSRRSESARETRSAIMTAAMRLFLQHGYGVVKVSDIAEAAGVAVPTVYTSAGGKSAILRALIDEAMRDPIVDSTLLAVRESNTGDRVIEVTARGVRLDNERYHNIIEVMTTAAVADESVAATLAHSDRTYRQALGVVAQRLADLGTLAPSLRVDTATDILWFYFGRDAWRLLVAGQEWSWDEAQRWLQSQAAHALLVSSHA